MTTWLTRAGEPVTVGDLVALSLLSYCDAVGRIIAPADRGAIRCVLVRCGSRPAGRRVIVEEGQLLVKVHR